MKGLNLIYLASVNANKKRSNKPKPPRKFKLLKTK